MLPPDPSAEHAHDPAALPGAAELAARVARLEAESTLAAAVGEMTRKLDILIELGCPICHDGIVNRLHPEREAEARHVATEILAQRNGQTPKG